MDAFYENLPAVSVILPCYNSEAVIRQSIECVLAQSFSDFELLVADDCSTDSTRNIIRSYVADDPRVHLVVTNHHVGAARMRNNCLYAARGRYIAFLNADDYWEPEKLETQIGFMRKHNVAFSFSTYTVFNKQGGFIRVIHTPRELTYNQYLCNTIICISSVVIDRDQTGMFLMPTSPLYSQTMALWLLILRRGFIAYGIDLPLVRYQEKRYATWDELKEAVKQVWRTYRQAEHVPLWRACFSFVLYGYHAARKRI